MKSHQRIRTKDMDWAWKYPASSIYDTHMGFSVGIWAHSMGPMWVPYGLVVSQFCHGLSIPLKNDKAFIHYKCNTEQWQYKIKCYCSSHTICESINMKVTYFEISTFWVKILLKVSCFQFNFGNCLKPYSCNQAQTQHDNIL